MDTAKQESETGVMSWAQASKLKLLSCHKDAIPVCIQPHARLEGRRCKVYRHIPETLVTL